MIKFQLLYNSTHKMIYFDILSNISYNLAKFSNIFLFILSVVILEMDVIMNGILIFFTFVYVFEHVDL